MKKMMLFGAVTTLLLQLSMARQGHESPGLDAVSDEVIAQQRSELARNTAGKGFGPQSPRDIDSKTGRNRRVFGFAPAHTRLNLCNIHFHKNAEHKGGEFTDYAGNGDGHGYGSGYRYAGELSPEELKPYSIHGEHGGLSTGDTIEVHFVFSSAQVEPGPTLGSCLCEEIANPQLRVEALVCVLVNDEGTSDFRELMRLEVKDGLHQAPGIPDDCGTPVQYLGSTTGPGYNEKGSPFHVTWSVRPEVLKVDIRSVEAWLHDNVFDEDHAHGVRNLVVNPDLLSSM